MPGDTRTFYFQPSWPPFIHDDVVYDLSHLDECVVEVTSKPDLVRRIVITFSDHCFTRPMIDDDDEAFVYPSSDRRSGVFSMERYECSLGIRAYIDYAINGKVWTAEGDSFAIIPAVQSGGQVVYYGIMFSLDRVTGLPVDLRMRVKTAFPFDRSLPVTFGHVRFKHLVELRMKGKSPGRITGQRRKWPKPGR